MVMTAENPGGPMVGVILAGGRSQRMGGGVKFLRPLAGRPILAHVISRLKAQVSTLVINANGDPQRFAAFGLPVIGDVVADYAGPLAGVHAGLEWARRHHPEANAIATVAADSPFFPADLVVRLAAAREKENAPLAVARSNAGLHPVFGLWSMTLEDSLLRALRDGERKMTDWVGNQDAGWRSTFLKSRSAVAESIRSLTSTALKISPRPSGFLRWKPRRRNSAL